MLTSKTNDFLFELGCEELPPGPLQLLQNTFTQTIQQALEKVNLSHGAIYCYTSPRRLTILIEALAEQQPDHIVERKGPALQAAFDASNTPTKAAMGFAQSCGVPIEKLERVQSEKGGWLLFKEHKKGESIETLMPMIFQQALANLPIPKPMRWGVGATSFVRPVHWALMCYGKKMIEATILDQTASNITFGHRFHHPQAIKIKEPKDYLETLEKTGHVLADFSQRQAKILHQLHALEKKKHIKVMVDPALLDQVTNLVEWPVAFLCEFDKDFLKVPPEVLIAAMQDHQKCFPVTDETGKLRPYFVTVSNIESKDTERVIVGNQRVMRARLNDAAFFYHIDCKERLIDRLDQLKHIVYQAKLGTLHDKVMRVQQLALLIANQLKVKSKLVERAALLSKLDLVTGMVMEFPELQGIMGYYYALHDGEDKAVATAIKEQYQPRFAKDRLPETDVGCVLALADRIDTLVSVFSIGERPTGEKDPFGLRRAAIAVLRILIEKNLDLDLHAILKQQAQSFKNQDVVEQLQTFFYDRLRYWYQEQGVSAEVISSVLAIQPLSPLDFHQRTQAVLRFIDLPEASSLAMANKRVKNILQKEGKIDINGEIKSSLLKEPAEIQLAKELAAKEKQLDSLITHRDYVAILNQLASLRDPVDQFFDHVMVNADDVELKKNRLCLLARLHKLFKNVADISVL